MKRKNPCNMGIWAKHEGMIDFGDSKRYVYRRRHWAYLWPGYWQAIWRARSHLIDLYTIKQHKRYSGLLEGAKLAFYLSKAALFDISSMMDFPVPKSMPEGVDTMYNCVRDDSEEWMINPYTGMPVRREHYESGH